MNLSIYPDPAQANAAACELLCRWLAASNARNVMVAAGNTPLELYRQVGRRGLKLSHLNVFALDEYVGVPMAEPRNCANLLRRAVAKAWGIPSPQFHAVSSVENAALRSVQAHERLVAKCGGLDVLVLGLGQNGHLGFNEPGSSEDSIARLLVLEPGSIEANRKWFNGDYAPGRGATVGMKTILEARRILLLAYGPHKAAAVQAMVEGPRGAHCPASFLQVHPIVHVFLDVPAASALTQSK